MSQADILFLAWNRLEFTRKSLEVLLANTDWDKISNLVMYDDGSEDGTKAFLTGFADNLVKCELRNTKGLGPVGIMRDYLSHSGAPLFVKIDNDTLLPPNWLNECLEVMEREPEIDLLGIEARIDAERSGPPPRQTYPAAFIGGIGIMRRKAFANDLPEAADVRSRFGFGKWQDRHPEANKAWLNPPLPVCLLNMVPFEPWASLSKEYVAKGWQRPWPDRYDEGRTDLWGWWA